MKTMALSFLSLPPEVRIQIYGYILISKDGFIKPQLLGSHLYFTALERAQSGQSASRPERRFSPERAILRTCRPIYSEAMAILYEQNTFRYLCGSSVYNDKVYPKLGFPDQHLDRIKHLEIELDLENSIEWIAPNSVGAMIQYFVIRGCDLQTFALSLDEMLECYGDDEDRHRLFWDIAACQEVMAALVELKVSKTLTISIRYRQKDDVFARKSLGDELQDFVNRLASGKAMTATKQELSEAIQYTAEDVGEYDFEEEDDDEEDRTLTSYEIMWCLRPQHSKQQSAKMTSASD